MALENCNDQPEVPADKVKAVTCCTALRLWTTWLLDVPPTGSTGERVTDRRLTSVFRALAALPDHASRFALLERYLFSQHDFPPPGAPRDLFRETLMRWWLDIFESQQSGAVPA